MRKGGTGSIVRRGDKWEAWQPNKKSTIEGRIGVYQFRFRAEQALDRWLAENINKDVDGELTGD
jgi:hypothetical protein